MRRYEYLPICLAAPRSASSHRSAHLAKAEELLGIGEIGLNKNSRNEFEILEAHLQLAADRDQMVLVHTPHLEDKLKGTRLIMDAIKANTSLDPGRVLIDHVEEHTVKAVLDRGFWAGMTLYPETKCTPQRAADIIEIFGTERLWMNSAGDWGDSDPLAVPKAVDFGPAAACAAKDRYLKP